MKPKARVVLLSTLALVVAGAVAIKLVVRGRGETATARAATASSAATDRAVPIVTAVVARTDVPIVLEGLGSVASLATVLVRTQVDGRLDRVTFTEGQRVKKGDAIALVDPRPFLIQLHAAEGVLARDDALLRNGRLNLGRYQSLRQGDLIPQQQVDDQRATVDQLDATTRSDKAQVENARLLLDYARITSPIDGITGVRQVDPGNIVHPADTNGIVVLTQMDPIAVLFTLPQDDLPRVQSALHEGKVGVVAYARDGIRKLARGELLLIDNQVTAQTATIRLKAILPNPEHVLWPNAFVKARLDLTTLKRVLVAPATVVQRGPAGTFAYVVGRDNTALVRPIEVASIEGETAIIGTGLAEGDVVVTDGQNQLRPGSRVAPRPPSPSPSRSAGPRGMP